ncbi:ABC transporter substrate-binding protein [uncultured Roseibium sp.]|uniref:ABC transporter substrate-binding protein n=1 Tax=uncultured Roseibium sp. TaxID=1936171 RepID=UPI003216E6DE
MMKKLKFTQLIGAAFALGAFALSTPSSAETVNFAWTPNPQTPQVDVAIAKGYFKDAGIDLNIVSFQSGREGFEALLGGQVDFTFMAEFPAATGALTGQKFGVVADLARFTGSRIIGSAKYSELKSPADLAGLKIGTTLGTNVDYYLSEVLKGAGVTAEVVNAAPADLAPALVRGDIQAAVMFPTFYSQAKKALGDDYRELVAPGYNVHFIIAASQGAIDGKEKMIEAFLGALAKADADVKADPEAAMEAVAANLKGAMGADGLKAMWKNVDIGLTLNEDLQSLLVSEGSWIVSKGVVKAEAPTMESIRPYLVDGPLKAVAPSMVTLP